jgi:hypothetical protein
MSQEFQKQICIEISKNIVFGTAIFFSIIKLVKNYKNKKITQEKRESSFF